MAERCLAEEDLSAPARTPLGARLAVPLAILSVYIIWGSTYLGIRVAIETIPPFLMSGVRFFLAGSLMLLFLRVRGAPLPSMREAGAAAAIGILLVFGGNGMVSFAEQTVASGLAAVLVATSPLWAALFAGFWGVWPNRLEVAGLALGLIGVVLLNVGTDLHAHPLGAAIVILAAASWAFGSIWSRYLPLPDGAMATTIEMLAGGAIMIAIGLARGDRVTAMPSHKSLIAMLYLVVFGSLIAFRAYTYLLQHVRPPLAMSYAYVNPAVAVLLGAVLLSEPVTGGGLLALVVIGVSVALVIMGRQRVST